MFGMKAVPCGMDSRLGIADKRPGLEDLMRRRECRAEIWGGLRVGVTHGISSMAKRHK